MDQLSSPHSHCVMSGSHEAALLVNWVMRLRGVRRCPNDPQRARLEAIWCAVRNTLHCLAQLPDTAAWILAPESQVLPTLTLFVPVGITSCTRLGAWPAMECSDDGAFEMDGTHGPRSREHPDGTM